LFALVCGSGALRVRTAPPKRRGAGMRSEVGVAALALARGRLLLLLRTGAA
jgi:hypothetical protein